jgi:hypothetical protein
MYTLMAIDTVLRIAAALVLMFIVVPALAWPRPASFSRAEWFWWNLGSGIAILTLAGQLFTLLNIAGWLSYLVLFAAIIVFGRARRAGVPPLRWLADSYRASLLVALQMLDGRSGLRQRIAASMRERRQRIAATLAEHRGAFLALTITGVVAAIVRFYRPFATANLGFPDTYGHLYLMHLLDEGRQVDPAWGPYPLGMHFVLLAIERLTNVDPILLMNFFGAFAGMLIALSVADTARRAARSNTAAIVAGILFATMIGGARQYFAFGGSVAAHSTTEASALLDHTYGELDRSAGEFDVLLTTFQRQTTTLPQELAIALLFPAVLFFIDWLRAERDTRWRLAGFIACTAAIASVHSGVVVPLVALCAAAAVATLITRYANLRNVARGALAGAAGVLIGSTWLVGFLRYREVAGRSSIAPGSQAGNTAQYYFPFLRNAAAGDEKAYMMITPFVIVALVLALLLAVLAFRSREPQTITLVFGAMFFIGMHAAPTLGLPELLEVRRNATWLAMTVAVTLGIAIAAIAARAPRRFAIALPGLAIVLWCATIPNIAGATMRARLLDYSGYGTTTYAVLRISQRLEPFTWTLISYGQEYPMVLGRGFHLPAADFVDRYDPTETKLRIPTPNVFIAVEKTPHRFQIDNWSRRFDRGAVEERLQTWCTVYSLTHRDMRVWLEDENVRIYEIAARAQR